VGISLIGGIVLVGFFTTKTVGFGKFTTSTLVLMLTLILSALLLASGHINSQAFTNVALGIVGFASGMVVGKHE